MAAAKKNNGSVMAGKYGSRLWRKSDGSVWHGEKAAASENSGEKRAHESQHQRNSVAAKINEKQRQRQCSESSGGSMAARQRNIGSVA